MISLSAHETQKNCCNNRNSFPASDESDGYNTFVIVSDRIFFSTALMYPPSLNVFISRSSDDFAVNRRRKLTVSPV